MQLEYIASGLVYTKLLTSQFCEREKLVQLAKDVFTKINNKYPEHRLGLLYNALMESKGVELITPYASVVNSIHTDSGGLQIAQKSKELTTELTEKVYAVQRKASHIAMSFDAIPIEIVGSGDARTDMSAKRYVASKTKEFGLISGQNVQNQIEFFKKNSGAFHTKPLIIIQGNSLEDFVTYFEAIKSQISPENYKEVGGFAIAGSAIGIGMLEALDSCFAFDCLDIPPEMGKHIHFLGYGSASRILPIITLLKNGVLSDYTISYDSTSHTSKYFMGSVCDANNKIVDFGKQPHNPKAMKIFGDVYDCFESEIYLNLGVSKEEWLKVVTADLVSSEKFHAVKWTPEEVQMHFANVFLCSFYSIFNFMGLIERLKTSDELSIEILGARRHQILKFIENNCISGEMWYNSIRQDVAHHLPSDRVPRIETSDEIATLDQFF